MVSQPDIPDTHAVNILPIHRFTLSEKFVTDYRTQPPPWGPLGEVTYRRTYSRLKEDGLQEEWWETVRRVVEGCYTYQKWHCAQHGLPWREQKAQRSAQTMYRLIFEMKFLPPGRGLWMAGTEYVERIGSASVSNCAFVSTANIDQDFSDPFTFLMDFSMLGVGVGGDCAGAGKVKIKQPEFDNTPHVVADTREGWVHLIRRVLDSFVGKASFPANIDYSLVRPAGQPIKGFGGVSAGPEPLDRLVGHILATLSPIIGQTITSKEIVDLFCQIGVCVVAGNVRRSAIIMLGESDDQIFCDLKDPETHSQELTEFRWASNNSIFAEVGQDYTQAAASTAHNGEPGYFWLANARAYSRMGEAPTWADRDAGGTNPCSFAGETIVHTINGPRRIDALADCQFWALVNDKAHLSPNGAWVTGEDDLYTLKTKEGFTVTVTANHRVMTPNGWIEAGQLQPGDQIKLHDHGDAWHWPGPGGTFEEGYTLGLLVGDGHYECGRPVLNVWKSDDGHEGVLEEGLRCAATLPHRKDWDGWRDHGRGVYALSAGLFAERFDLYKGNKHITEAIELDSSELQRGFLRGMFDADGHIEGVAQSQTNWSIRLGQSHYGDLQAVQRMLLRFGIFSRIYHAKDAGVSVLPDGKGGEKEYQTKEAWRLVIGASNVRRFAERIGFAHTAKAAKLTQALETDFYTKPFLATFASLTFARRDRVWDLSVSDAHAFDANGLYVSNSEQTLCDHELCVLAETFPSRHESYDEYEKTLKYAYLYAKSITLVPTHNPTVNARVMRNRRIGCSQSGIFDAFAKHGKRAYLGWCDKGYAYLRNLDRLYSDWLCVPLSRKITSVKPSGTVSLLPGVSPGIHAPHAQFYYRTIRIAKNSSLVKALSKAGYRIEDAVTDPNTVVAYFPVQEVNYDRSKDQVTLWEQLENAAALQQHWADNQVSVTVTFKPEEADDIKRALELYETRLKGVSFLPLTNHGYAQAPYQTITEAEYLAAVKKLKPINFSATEHETTDAYCDGDVCNIPVK